MKISTWPIITLDVVIKIIVWRYLTPAASPQVKQFNIQVILIQINSLYFASYFHQTFRQEVRAWIDQCTFIPMCLWPLTNYNRTNNYTVFLLISFFMKTIYIFIFKWHRTLPLHIFLCSCFIVTLFIVYICYVIKKIFILKRV